MHVAVEPTDSLVDPEFGNLQSTGAGMGPLRTNHPHGLGHIPSAQAKPAIAEGRGAEACPK